MEKFEGPLDELWKMPNLPNIKNLTWDWWWWIVMWPSKKYPDRSEQLMILWSTKETPAILVNNKPWIAAAKPNSNEENLVTLPGMTCGWYYDGERMYEPLVFKNERIVSISSQHEDWKTDSSSGGAVITLTDQLLSTGLTDDKKKFWIRLESDENAVENGAPQKFEIEMRPWNAALSKARRSFQKYQKNLGYDIIRIHGCKAEGKYDNEVIEGSAYLQKVRVQAPTIPWYWGFLHFSDGSYIDWFIPHISPLAFSSSDKSWQMKDFLEISLSKAALFHDAERQRTEKFKKLKLKKSKSNYLIEKNDEKEILPRFEIEMWNGRTMIVLTLDAISRAYWSFDQPTRGGMISHLCYNEYPLKVAGIAIQDEIGIRTIKHWDWIHGNAEHSWGILH
ncbi:MAG: hypothetical protein CMB56_000390 [Methanobacteriota archaeon]|nr:MAG: hypothetical protein CMB56_000390 [Euryarchaeota archaeon]|tara:strand:+ start:5240 stop:6415 length:1176 start_codon:yes stop_codon:yes gene_type:complete